MKNKLHIVKNINRREETVAELQRLLACYQIASFDDRKVVWAVLNKSVTEIGK